MNPTGFGDLPPELWERIAGDVTDPVDRQSMRLSRRFVGSAMGDPSREEHVTAMLRHVLRHRNLAVRLLCWRPQGPLRGADMALPGMVGARFDFIPRLDRRQRDRFRVHYYPPPMDMTPNHMILLRDAATLQEAVAYLAEHSCRAKEAWFIYSPATPEFNVPGGSHATQFPY